MRGGHQQPVRLIMGAADYFNSLYTTNNYQMIPHIPLQKVSFSLKCSKGLGQLLQHTLHGYGKGVGYFTQKNCGLWKNGYNASELRALEIKQYTPPRGYCYTPPTSYLNTTFSNRTLCPYVAKYSSDKSETKKEFFPSI